MKNINNTRKEILLQLNTLKIDPNNFEKRKYEVEIKYYSENIENPIKQINYNLNIDIERNETTTLIINKENYTLKQNQEDNLIDIINHNLSNIIYPLTLQINEKFQIIKILVNFQNLKKKWKTVSKKLTSKNNSLQLDELLEKSTQILTNKINFEEYLYQDWLWNILMHPKFLQYNKYQTKSIDFYLSIIPSQKPIKFKGNQKISKNENQKISYCIDFESIEMKAHKYFIEKYKFITKPILMKLEVQSEIDVFHHFLIKTKASLIIYSKDKYHKNNILHQIDFNLNQKNLNIYNENNLSGVNIFL